MVTMNLEMTVAMTLCPQPHGRSSATAEEKEAIYRDGGMVYWQMQSSVSSTAKEKEQVPSASFIPMHSEPVLAPAKEVRLA